MLCSLPTQRTWLLQKTSKVGSLVSDSQHLTDIAIDAELSLGDPECYLLGKERSGAKATGEFLVIEDSPAGVRAGKAAGCAVLGLATTHSIERVKGAGSDWSVKDLRECEVSGLRQSFRANQHRAIRLSRIVKSAYRWNMIVFTVLR